MADEKTPKRRGRAPVVPLTVDATPAIAAEPMPLPIAPAAAIVPPLVVPAAAVHAETPVEDAAPAVAEAPAAPAPEPAMTDSVMMEPAPAAAVATLPSPPAEPVIDEATAPAEPPSKGTTKMATSFQPAPTAETAEKAKAMFGDMNMRAKAAMEKSVKLGEEMTELTKGNVEALIQSSRVAAKGAETMAQEAAEAMKKNFESASATMKSFASVKSPTELFQLQSEAAKSYFDSAVADMSKFTEQMMKLAGDVAQPLSSRYSVAMEKVKSASL